MLQNVPDNRPPKAAKPKVRSAPLQQWPEPDRSAWTAARRPAERLKKGGSASHLSEDWCRDLARRYGYFLDHVERTEGDLKAGAADLVTPERVERYIAELKARVGSVTTYGSIYKLRRMAQLLAPGQDYRWLIEIEKDLELVAVPKSSSIGWSTPTSSPRLA
jgi:hypothetical protein